MCQTRVRSRPQVNLAKPGGPRQIKEMVLHCLLAEEWQSRLGAAIPITCGLQRAGAAQCAASQQEVRLRGGCRQKLCLVAASEELSTFLESPFLATEPPPSLAGKWMSHRRGNYL